MAQLLKVQYFYLQFNRNCWMMQIFWFQPTTLYPRGRRYIDKFLPAVGIELGPFCSKGVLYPWCHNLLGSVTFIQQIDKASSFSHSYLWRARTRHSWIGRQSETCPELKKIKTQQFNNVLAGFGQMSSVQVPKSSLTNCKLWYAKLLKVSYSWNRLVRRLLTKTWNKSWTQTHWMVL